MKYFLYARKSTEDEERQVMSIEAQIFELEEYAKRENISIDQKFIESKSAKKPGRPIFNKMVEAIYASKEPSCLLAWHPDRLARNSVDGGQIIYLIDTEKLASLRFPTFWFEPTPQGLFMLQVAFGQSKYYSDNLSENVKRGLRQKLRRGEWSNLAPLGYINDPKTRNLAQDTVKAKVIKKAFKEFADNKHTFESLAKRLSFWGMVSRNHKPLCKASIQRMLTNPVYIGLIQHNGETFEGKFKPMVSKYTFDAVQKILAVRAKPRKKKTKHDFPFTGLFSCGECRAAITAQYAKGNGGTYIYYRCTKKLKNCSQKYIRHDLLVKQVQEKLSQVAISQDWHDNMIKQIELWGTQQHQSTENMEKELIQETKNIETKLDFLINAFLEHTIDRETYINKKSELIKNKIDLQERKSALSSQNQVWLEPLKNFVNQAHYAQELTFSKDFTEVKSSWKTLERTAHLPPEK
jgi:DNA invertase Pin-like site-specific DNA recombinase